MKDQTTVEIIGDKIEKLAERIAAGRDFILDNLFPIYLVIFSIAAIAEEVFK
jgi:hypothetical protein